MAVQHPRLFGYEAQIRWDTTLFPVDESVGKYVPTGAEILAWLPAANQSDEERRVNITVDQEVFEMTSRPRAATGYRSSFVGPKSISASFSIHHQYGTNKFMHALIDAWQLTQFTGTGAIALAFLDRDNAGTNERGLIGNFRVSMSKREPLKDFQEWSVVAYPVNYVEYIDTEDL